MTRVLVLRAQGKVRPLHVQGIDIIQIPVIKTVPNENVIKNLQSISADYVVVMSTVVVKYVGDALRQLGRNAKVVGVGPRTCEEVEKLGIKCEIPSEFSSQGIVNFMSKLPQGRVVILRSTKGNDYLGSELRRAGHQVIEYRVYDVEVDAINAAIACKLLNYVDYVVFMSPMTYRALKDCDKDLLRRKTVIAIGRTTASEISRYGINAIIPGEYTYDGVINLLIKSLNYYQ